MGLSKLPTLTTSRLPVCRYQYTPAKMLTTLRATATTTTGRPGRSAVPSTCVKFLISQFHSPGGNALEAAALRSVKGAVERVQDLSERRGLLMELCCSQFMFG